MLGSLWETDSESDGEPESDSLWLLDPKLTDEELFPVDLLCSLVLGEPSLPEPPLSDAPLSDALLPDALLSDLLLSDLLLSDLLLSDLLLSDLLLSELLLSDLLLSDPLLSDLLLLASLLEDALDDDLELPDEETLDELEWLLLDESLLLDPLDPLLLSLDEDVELEASIGLELSLPLDELDRADDFDPDELADILPTEDMLDECDSLKLEADSESDAELESLLLDRLLELLGDDDEFGEPLDDDECEEDEETEDELPDDDEPSQQRQPIVR